MADNFCSNCGAKLEEGTNFCPSCGKNSQYENVFPYQEDKTFSEMFLRANGRLNRWRYFKRMMLIGVLEFILVVLTVLVFFDKWTEELTAMGYILVTVIIAACIPIQYFLMIRRLHDLNKTGWLSILMTVPFINAPFAMYLLLAMGTVGSNQYGADPLEGKR